MTKGRSERALESDWKVVVGIKVPHFKRGLLPRKRSGNDFSFTPLKEPPRDVIK